MLYGIAQFRYYKKLNYKRFRPYSKKQAKAQIFDHIEIKDDTLKNNKFSGIYDWFNPNSKHIESIKETHNGNTYQIYRDVLLEESNWGYWLKINNDFISKSYYLGITENYFYHIKAKQTIHLVKNDSTIQVQSAIIRQTKPEILPSDPPEFKLVTDYIILEFNINHVIKDTDKDGLTDIFEAKLLLNPRLKDTDKDGINDINDSNPRFKSWETEKSKLYSYILANQTLDSLIVDTNIIFRGSFRLKHNSPTLIVSDDESLHHIKPLITSDYFIILTEEEFKKSKKKYPTNINRLYISPLFKVDNIDNCYKIHISGYSSGNDYVIYKLNEQWIIKNIGGYII